MTNLPTQSRALGLALALATVSSACSRSHTPQPQPTTPPPGAPAGQGSKGTGNASLLVWANDGGDKVTRDELRLRQGAAGVLNSVWDGNHVKLSAARNEVVSFNLVLEAPEQDVTGVQVRFKSLEGPEKFEITSRAASGNGVFDWRSRNIELFDVGYLQIKGLSRLSYELYDERHIPKRLRRPFSAQGEGKGTWKDRPDHDKFYPDIAVPLELRKQGLSIASETNRSVWVDVFVPKKAPAGTYHGTVSITAPAFSQPIEVPVELEVRKFALPDVPSSKTMVFLGYANLGEAYLGEAHPNAGTPNERKLTEIRNRHFLMAHRHKLSLIDSDEGGSRAPSDRPRDEWLARLQGSLFTSHNGYDGPGIGTSNGVYSIGTYGNWSWKNGAEGTMWQHADAWENWFASHYPEVERFLYLVDESPRFAETETWARWMTTNPGPGRALPSFATLPMPSAIDNVPSLSIIASWFTVGPQKLWEDASRAARASKKRIYMYNGKRPSNGSFATEDDGVALRELAWAQYKKQIDRWFYWESTYYKDYQNDRGNVNVFKTAMTFGRSPIEDPVTGERGGNYSNGDGLLFYPGRDTRFPSENLGVDGPVASLRMKHWRRGIQDVDYLTLAKAVNPAAVQAIVDRMVPKALWDYGINDPSDPTWVRSDISWSISPDDWEAARHELADLIEGKTSGAGANPVATRTPQSSEASAAAPSGPGVVTRAKRWLKRVLGL